MNKLLFVLLLMLQFSVNAEFVKINQNGASISKDSKQWQCVLDKKTQLMWEVKTPKKGLQSNQNTYTWFDGSSGVENGEFSHHCHWGRNCNTQAYVNAINEKQLCGFNNWRLPSAKELKTLLLYKDDNPLINSHFFPHTQSRLYWSQDTDSKQTGVAIDVPFFYGGTSGSAKSFDSYIRAVRNAH